MTKKQIQEFFKKLEGKGGCDFREKIKGDPDSLTWKCKGGNDKSLSEIILKKMKIKKADADKFLSRCDSYGGHCDCEIIFNAANHF